MYTATEQPRFDQGKQDLVYFFESGDDVLTSSGCELLRSIFPDAVLSLEKKSNCYDATAYKIHSHIHNLVRNGNLFTYL